MGKFELKKFFCSGFRVWFFLILSGGFCNFIYSEWEVRSLDDHQLYSEQEKGNFDIYNNRFVWEGFDGNDWEIYYHRPFDKIRARRFGLVMHNGDGTSHNKGGITKVGGKKRIQCVANDYEGLCFFDLRAFSGTIERARLEIIFQVCTCPNPPTKGGSSPKCPPPPTREIVVYNENKGPWDKNTVHYNTFNHCPWDQEIGRIEVANMHVPEVTMSNARLKNLVQRWVNNPNTNKGLVLTADFSPKKYKHFKVKQVYLYVIFTQKIIQLTDNDIDEYDPDIDRHFITWSAWDGYDSEIFFWNGFRVIQLTDNDFDEYNSHISANMIVWEGFDGENWDIYVRQRDTVKNISDNGYDHYEPSISEGKVTWYGEADENYDFEIFYFDGQNTLQITDNDDDDWLADLDNGMITWQGFDGNDTEIYYWSETNPFISALTDNLNHDGYPKISHGRIVWSYFDDSDWEIMLWTGNQTIQVTDNTANDYTPAIDKNGIAWSGHDGSDYDIYYFDQNGLELVYDNTDNDYTPILSNDKIIWKTWEYDSTSATYGYELYLANKLEE